jgi:hypothetical protein
LVVHLKQHNDVVYVDLIELDSARPQELAQKISPSLVSHTPLRDAVVLCVMSSYFKAEPPAPAPARELSGIENDSVSLYSSTRK